MSLTRFSLSLTLLAMIAVVNAAAAPNPEALLQRLSNLQTIVQKRQSSDSNDTTTVPLSQFPPQCQSGCAPAINATNTCSSIACLCNTTIDNSFQQCILCSVNANPQPSVVQDGQQVIDSYNNICKGAGIPSLTLTVTNTAATPIGGFVGPTTTIDSLPSTSASATTRSSSNGVLVGPRVSIGYISVGLVIAVLASLA